MNIKPSEVSKLLLEQLQGIKNDIEYEEVGTVLQVSDGVVRIYGLYNAEAEELLEFDNGIKAIVMNLEEDNVGAILLGPTDRIKEGMTVKRTGRIASIDVSDAMIGRVITPLGEPLDGKGDIVVNISVYIPESLSKDEKKAMEHFKESDNFRPTESIKEQIFRRFKNFFD